MVKSDSDTTLDDQPVSETPFTFWSAYQFLKRNENQPIVNDLIRLILLLTSARERAISVSGDELQDAADDFRYYLKLDSAEDTFAYLECVGLELEEFEFLLETEVLYSKLRQSLSCADAVQGVFARNLHLFETIELAGLAFDTIDEAKKIHANLVKGKTAFPDPQPEQSGQSDGENNSIYLGYVTRTDLPEEVASKVFADSGSEFVGPVKNEGRYWIYRLLLPKRAEMNEIVYEICEELIVREFLNEKCPDIPGRFSP